MKLVTSLYILRVTVAAMEEDGEVAAIGMLLEDEVARSILVHSHGQFLSAPSLAQVCDVSEPTIYRRLERLRTHDLLTERTVPDSRGHHYKEYQANLHQLTVRLTDDGFDVQIDRRETPADRFTALIEEM